MAPKNVPKTEFKFVLPKELMPQHEAQKLVDRANDARRRGRIDHRLECRFSIQEKRSSFFGSVTLEVFRIDSRRLQGPLLLEHVEKGDEPFGQPLESPSLSE